MTVELPGLPRPTVGELTDRLVGWCAIGSGSDDPAGLEQMRAVLEPALRGLPGAVESVPLGPVGPAALRCRCRSGAPLQVLLSAHYDTVYGPGHPFRSCRHDGEVLRGPGVADDKGGIVVMLAALEMFERTAGAHRLGWEVILGPDEEIGSPGTAPLYRAAALEHDLALVFEPCREDGGLVRGRMGTGTVTVTCHGRAAHAGRSPELGRNAVLGLAGFLLAAARLPDSLPGTLINVARVQGGGALNTVPDLAVAELGVRVTRAGDDALLLARLRELAASTGSREGIRLEVAGHFHRPPLVPSPATERLFAAYHECARAMGLEVGWENVGGASDGNLLAAGGLPVLDGLGPRGGALHSDGEWVETASLGERARAAALFLCRLAADAPSFRRSFRGENPA